MARIIGPRRLQSRRGENVRVTIAPVFQRMRKNDFWRDALLISARECLDGFFCKKLHFREELVTHRPRRVLNHITQLPAALQPLICAVAELMHRNCRYVNRVFLFLPFITETLPPIAMSTISAMLRPRSKMKPHLFSDSHPLLKVIRIWRKADHPGGTQIDKPIS
jgi:hypothetical protein